MSNQHTPGPWCVGSVNAAEGHNIYSGKDYIAHSVGYYPRPGSNQRTLLDKEALANARLIAAAPELLAALETALAMLTAIHPLRDHAADEWREKPAGIYHLENAIAKAKGGAQ